MKLPLISTTAETQVASRIYTAVENYSREAIYLHKHLCKMRFQKLEERDEAILKDPLDGYVSETTSSRFVCERALSVTCWLMLCKQLKYQLCL